MDTESQEELSRILQQEPEPELEWTVVPRVAFKFAYWPLSQGARQRLERLRREGRQPTFQEVEGKDISRAWESFSEGAGPEEGRG